MKAHLKTLLWLSPVFAGFGWWLTFCGWSALLTIIVISVCEVMTVYVVDCSTGCEATLRMTGLVVAAGAPLLIVASILSSVFAECRPMAAVAAMVGYAALLIAGYVGKPRSLYSVRWFTVATLLGWLSFWGMAKACPTFMSRSVEVVKAVKVILGGGATCSSSAE